MKNTITIFSIVVLLTSCASINQSGLTRSQVRNDLKLVQQANIRKAVESRRYIIKLDRIYFNHGGIAELVPRRNYIIIDGEKAIINAAYLGRQFDIRPISGINIHGLANNYISSLKESKGQYEVNLKVNNGSASFNLYLTITKSGICTASLSGSIIDLVRYQGEVVPISEKSVNKPQGIII